MRVAFFATCVADSFFAESALAAVHVLRALGVDVVVPPGQTCCGQPAFNAGHRSEARRMAAHTVREFEGADAIVLPSGSCAGMMRVHYPGLFGAVSMGNPTASPARAVAEDVASRTWELTEFIVKRLGITELGDGLEGLRIAWHHGCHALRELGVHEEPLLLLRNAGAEIVDWEATDECCGFGGVFAVKMPEVSVAMADRKIDALLSGAGAAPAAPDVLTSTDAGCLLHLAGRMQRRGIRVPVRHVADLLWVAMQGAAGDRRAALTGGR